MGWGRWGFALVGVAALAGCAAPGGTAESQDLCVLTPAEVSSALGVTVDTVEPGAAGAGAPASETNFQCTYSVGKGGARVVDFSGWPGTPAIGNEAEDPDGTRNPQPATVAGSPTAYFTNSGKAIRFGDGKNVYTIWIYDGTRPQPSDLEGLAETALQRLATSTK